MPELPEVETVRRTLEKNICGKEIESVQIYNDDVLDGVSSADFKTLLIGNRVDAVDRRGKYLIFCLADGNRLILHLRMTGRAVYFNEKPLIDRHCHVIIGFKNGGGIYYQDVRRFGRFCPIGSGGKTEKGLQSLGPEPFDRKFTVNYVREGFHGRRCPVKARLLDQHFIAGIGNIYADEILFEARVYPEKYCDELTNCQMKRIKKAAEKILAKAVEHRGTTFSDYRDGNGEAGEHADYLKVFHRDGQPCPVCGTVIEKIKCGGRTTSFCPKCQKR